VPGQASERLGSGGRSRYATGSGGVSVASQLQAWRQRRGVPLDITALPGMEALSSKVIDTPALCLSITFALEVAGLHYISK
jgi:hypothetical protein